MDFLTCDSGKNSGIRKVFWRDRFKTVPENFCFFADNTHSDNEDK